MLLDGVLASIMLGFSAWTFEVLERSEHAAYFLACCLLLLLWRSVVLSAPASTTKLVEGDIGDVAKALPPTPTKPAIVPVTCNAVPTPSEKLILTSLVDEPIGSIRILVGPQGACGGRLEKNEIILEDSVVSRVHFSLSCVRNTYYLQDVGSTTGTFLYLAPHETRLLSMHDHVKIGDTEFRIVDASFHGKSSPYLQIKFTKGPMEGVTQRIGASLVTIGRKTSCTLCIENDVTVSGAHCTIEFRAAAEPLSTSSVELDSDDERLCGFYLTDLGSTNGTGFRLSPSGLPSEKTRLHHGDVFGVGCTRFLVQHATKLHEEAGTRIA
ncbi:hypothetical protein SDRG_00416 [Saprolegnia diclina VS20]|uniref:FHA domain-containing protein n=1 Tax=Saprolegnia diclina (strain VS20) TaxID=1156394 RepID=T0QWS5_SAPDV|nr:hypothetical protein SDRG_00416 [Saprolegnia diclina VS20]EQC42689.1 hypothetical protein SDRG_00416 [Saprolegnia diclina VS20]|eukprot:XP_008604112.1 hypothetical protein SDRG_00416 [Saprolegnia diclina VS20]